jgi:hypothetical protein
VTSLRPQPLSAYLSLPHTPAAGSASAERGALKDTCTRPDRMAPMRQSGLGTAVYPCLRLLTTFCVVATLRTNTRQTAVLSCPGSCARSRAGGANAGICTMTSSQPVWRVGRDAGLGIGIAGALLAVLMIALPAEPSQPLLTAVPIVEQYRICGRTGPRIVTSSCLQHCFLASPSPRLRLPAAAVEGGPVTLAQRGLRSSSTCATAIPI